MPTEDERPAPPLAHAQRAAHHGDHEAARTFALLSIAEDVHALRRVAEAEARRARSSRG